MSENAENGKVVDGKVISTCHNSPLDGSVGDGVMVGSCPVCSTNIVRRTVKSVYEPVGPAEYLDGRPLNTEDQLRPVVL